MFGDVRDDRPAQESGGVVPAERAVRDVRARVEAVTTERRQVDAADERDAVVHEHELLVVTVHRSLLRVEPEADLRPELERVPDAVEVFSIRMEERQRRPGPQQHSDVADEPVLRPLMQEFEAKTRSVLKQLDGGDILGGTRRFVEEVALGPGMWQRLPAVARELFMNNAPTFLDENRSPARRVGAIDNRGSHFYLAMYWAQELANQADDADLAAAFKPLADTQTAQEKQIVDELIAVQGSPADIGGYYQPDPAKASAVMRPSATFNAAVASLA